MGPHRSTDLPTLAVLLGVRTFTTPHNVGGWPFKNGSHSLGSCHFVRFRHIRHDLDLIIVGICVLSRESQHLRFCNLGRLELAVILEIFLIGVSKLRRALSLCTH